MVSLLRKLYVPEISRQRSHSKQQMRDGHACLRRVTLSFCTQAKIAQVGAIHRILSARLGPASSASPRSVLSASRYYYRDDRPLGSFVRERIVQGGMADYALKAYKSSYTLSGSKFGKVFADDILILPRSISEL
jgi:hypothetical protein